MAVDRAGAQIRVGAGRVLLEPSRAPAPGCVRDRRVRRIVAYEPRRAEVVERVTQDVGLTGRARPVRWCAATARWRSGHGAKHLELREVAIAIATPGPAAAPRAPPPPRRRSARPSAPAREPFDARQPAQRIARLHCAPLARQMRSAASRLDGGLHLLGEIAFVRQALVQPRDLSGARCSHSAAPAVVRAASRRAPTRRLLGRERRPAQHRRGVVRAVGVVGDVPRDFGRAARISSTRACSPWRRVCSSEPSSARRASSCRKASEPSSLRTMPMPRHHSMASGPGVNLQQPGLAPAGHDGDELGDLARGGWQLAARQHGVAHRDGTAPGGREHFGHEERVTSGGGMQVGGRPASCASVSTAPSDSGVRCSRRRLRGAGRR